MKITLNIDEDIVKKARKIAIDKDTTLMAMVRDYLTWLASGDAAKRRKHILMLEESFVSLSRDMGERNTPREHLHIR